MSGSVRNTFIRVCVKISDCSSEGQKRKRRTEEARSVQTGAGGGRERRWKEETAACAGLGLTARKSPCVQGPSSLVGSEPGCANRDADGALALPGPPRLSWSFLDLTSTVEGRLCFGLRCRS